VNDIRLTKTALAIFTGALIGVPVIAAAALGHDIATDSEPVLAEVVGPPALAAAIALLFVLHTPRKVSGDETPRQAWDKAPGAAIIVGAALVGTFSDLLPRALDALLTGLVLGFFIGLGLVVVRLWRSDSTFRKSIRIALDR
jgi:hypothetical protein